MKWLIAIRHGISFGDVVILLGVSFFGYGLWLYRPWVGFAATGIVLIWLGIGFVRSEKAA